MRLFKSYHLYTVFLLVALLFCLNSDYLYQQSLGQIGMRWNQIPIEEAILIEEKAEYKDLLRQVSKIKKFAEKKLYLTPSKNYSDYFKVDQEGVTFAVTASKKDKLEAYTWWFPIVGTVPYLGFYDKEAALEEKRELEEEGYDTWLFAVPAYSTLGWFKDPVTTPMLQNGLYYLTSTIIHELTHLTLYVDGESNFNEQLASFVALKGAVQYYKENGLAHEKLLRSLERNNHNYIKLSALTQKYIEKLKDLYHSKESFDEKLQKRELIFNSLESEIINIYPHTKKKDWKMNNARLLQYKRYRKNAIYLDEIWKKSEHSWSKFWVLIQIYLKELKEKNQT